MSQFTREILSVKLLPRPASTAPLGTGLLFGRPETWKFLRQAVLPQLLAGKNGAPLRVWCAGPGAGEDAYSIVLLLAELIGSAALSGRAKVFATESEDARVSPLQMGRCPADALANVPERQRRQYFDRLDADFALLPTLREVIFFGRQNLVTDVPLGRLDILLCRHALSGFDRSSARLVLKRLTYGLQPWGCLVTGPGDRDLASTCGLLEPVEPNLGVFRKAGSCRVRSLMPLAALRPQVRPEAGQIGRELPASLGDDQACGHLLLDDHGALLGADDTAWRMLELGPDLPDRPPADLALFRVRKTFRGAVQAALATGTPSLLQDLEWQTCSGEPSRLDVEIVPTRGPGGCSGRAIVRLRPAAWRRASAFRASDVSRSLEVAAEILNASEEELRAACEELEEANQELQQLNQRLADANAALVAQHRELSERCAELRAALDANAVPQTALPTTGAGIIVGCNAATGDGPMARADGVEPPTSPGLARLTPRELEVMRLLVEGNQSKEIAHQLGISRRTVDIHRGRLMRKMNARSAADLTRIAIADRLIGHS